MWPKAGLRSNRRHEYARIGMRSRTNPCGKAITQELLRRLGRLRTDKKLIEDQIDETQRTILDLHRSGAPVEPGGLDYKLCSGERRQFTRANLAELLGEAEAERLRMMVRPARYCFITVGKAEDSTAMPRDHED